MDRHFFRAEGTRSGPDRYHPFRYISCVYDPLFLADRCGFIHPAVALSDMGSVRNLFECVILYSEQVKERHPSK